MQNYTIENDPIRAFAVFEMARQANCELPKPLNLENLTNLLRENDLPVVFMPNLPANCDGKIDHCKGDFTLYVNSNTTDEEKIYVLLHHLGFFWLEVSQEDEVHKQEEDLFATLIMAENGLVKLEE